MNLKKYVTDQFMIYCFEIGFESAVIKIQKELTEINLDDFIYNDLLIRTPENINKKTKFVMDTYTMLINRTPRLWFQVYQNKISSFGAQKRLFQKLEELGLQPQN